MSWGHSGAFESQGGVARRGVVVVVFGATTFPRSSGRSIAQHSYRMR
jgi:hypothetical protein